MPSNDKIVVIPDTNYFYNDEQEETTFFKLNMGSYFKFQKTISINNLDDKIQMYVPELVLCELIAHHKKYLKETESKEIKNINFDEYCMKLRNKYLDGRLNIIDIPCDKEKLFKDILKRALDKIPPFKKKSDPGFKDTIIFLSVLEFSKLASFDKYILVTNDGLGSNKECLQEQFLEYNQNPNISLEVMTKNEFRDWSNEEYELFVDLRQYLEEKFYDNIWDKYYRTSTISWGNGDTLVEEYELIKEDTEFYQIGESEYEITIYLDIEINRSQDAAIGEFYEKNDKYIITQRETYIFERIKRDWKVEFKSSAYEICYDIWDESFMLDEYP